MKADRKEGQPAAAAAAKPAAAQQGKKGAAISQAIKNMLISLKQDLSALGKADIKQVWRDFIKVRATLP